MTHEYPGEPVEVLLAEAFRHHQAGRLDEAGRLYRQILAIDPRHADCLHLSGLVAYHAGRYEAAVDLIGQAIAVDATAAMYHSNLGNALKDLGRLDDAVACWRRALDLKPTHPEAHNNLGLVLRERGLLAEALEHCRMAVALRPDFADAHNNLGGVLLGLRRAAEAVESFHRALALQPNLPEAHNNLGGALVQLGRIDDAVESFRRAITLRPDYADAYFHLGAVLQRLGRPSLAAEAYERAVTLKLTDPKVDGFRMCGALQAISRVDAGKACALARRLLDTVPEGDVLHRALGGIAGGGFSAETERCYTIALFDRFADEFDATLGQLHYDMPEQLARAAGLATGDGPADLDVLDAGCGTGLCGIHLRSRSRRLVGVDLSARMLDKARARGLYDDLACGDVVAFMEANPAAFDLVLAADVLIYIGDLAVLARAAYRALRPGGICAVSAESLEREEAAGFALAPSGRYQHTAGYLQAIFSAAGFVLDPLHRTAVRLEYSVPVPAWIVIGRKGRDPAGG